MPKSLHTPRHLQLLDLLVNAQKATGMTKAVVARALGRPQSFVAKHENGERRIDIVEFIDITAALETTPANILAKIVRSERIGEANTNQTAPGK